MAWLPTHFCLPGRHLLSGRRLSAAPQSRMQGILKAWLVFCLLLEGEADHRSV